MEEIKRNERGDVIYRKKKMAIGEAIEEWWEHDKNGNVVRYRNSEGRGWSQEFDSDGNNIHFIGSEGDEQWRGYKGNAVDWELRRDKHGNWFFNNKLLVRSLGSLLLIYCLCIEFMGVCKRDEKGGKL